MVQFNYRNHLVTIQKKRNVRDYSVMIQDENKKIVKTLGGFDNLRWAKNFAWDWIGTT